MSGEVSSTVRASAGEPIFISLNRTYHRRKGRRLYHRDIGLNSLGEMAHSTILTDLLSRLRLPERSQSARRCEAIFSTIEQLSETLAMSNLAQKFMSAGFLSEAEQECESALKIQDFHQNAATTLAEVKALPEEEQKKKTEVLEKARPLSDFYKQFGRATSRPCPADTSARWKGPQREFSVRIVGGEFEATGSYEQKPLATGLAAFLGPLPAAQNRPDRYHVKYKGACRGRAIEGTMSRTLEDDPVKIRGLLSLAEYKTEVLMYLTEDGNEIRVMRSRKRVWRDFTG
jgi:hypothetical protein